VTSVGITIPGDLDQKRLKRVAARSADRRRGRTSSAMKGVLSLKGDARRYVFQGVHMLMGTAGQIGAWGKGTTHNKLIFIGGATWIAPRSPRASAHV